MSLPKRKPRKEGRPRENTKVNCPECGKRYNVRSLVAHMELDHSEDEYAESLSGSVPGELLQEG